MHVLHALIGQTLLRVRKRRPLDDPLDGPEWAGLWRLFAWRAAIGRRLRNRKTASALRNRRNAMAVRPENR